MHWNWKFLWKLLNLKHEFMYLTNWWTSLRHIAGDTWLRVNYICVYFPYNKLSILVFFFLEDSISLVKKSCKANHAKAPFCILLFQWQLNIPLGKGNRKSRLQTGFALNFRLYIKYLEWSYIKNPERKTLSLNCCVNIHFH